MIWDCPMAQRQARFWPARTVATHRTPAKAYPSLDLKSLGNFFGI